MNWTEQCEAMERAHPDLHDFLETWGRYSGAPRDVFRGHLCKLLQELVAPRAEGFAPEGWKLVPVEPTKEMKKAGGRYRDETIRQGTQRTAGGYYRSMVAAAPSPPMNPSRPAAPGEGEGK